MKKSNILSLAIGSAFAVSALAPAVAASNPFAATALDQGYQLAQTDKKTDGKCGEAKCGADKAAAEKKVDGKCGEAKCGADKKAEKAEKKADGKCGEAKCGNSHK